MEQFVSEKDFYVSPESKVVVLLLEENNYNYYDFYNIVNDKVYFIGRFVIEPYIHYIDYAINGNYLLVYNYESMVGESKYIVTKVLKFYNLIDNISIIDSIDNVLNKFGVSYLVSNSSKSENEKYDNSMIDKKSKFKSLNTLSLLEFNKYLSELKNNSIKNNTIDKKIVYLADYVDNKLPSDKEKTKI